ncbi:MAG TPA: G1 family glutamic endopeptidase [Ktedonobacteraceae bacterium]|nr:G1 family glutamic endopeptidase [Ktedonobacteraceae bacterium]
MIGTSGYTPEVLEWIQPMAPNSDEARIHEAQREASYRARPCRRKLLYLSLALLILLSGCAGLPSDTASAIGRTPPAHPLIYTFLLSAQQRLRDIAGDFSVGKRGADTGIPVLPGEKIEIFASGSAGILPGGKQSGPAGTLTCNAAALPYPDFPCYSVIYSVGIAGQVGGVGAHVGFNPTTAGNLFLGVNASNVANNTGAFHITVLIVPAKTMAGLWNSPEEGFLVQGAGLQLSAYVFAQHASITDVEFTAAIAGQAPVPICRAVSSGNDLYTCHWDLTLHGTYLHNGPFTLGFTINGNTGDGSVLATGVNPDGTRSGTIRYILPQPNTYYAGYAAMALDQRQPVAFQKVTGQWTVPQAHCSAGETSLSATWVGMTSDATDKSLLAQLGSDSDCQAGDPQYYLWWETFPDPAVPLDLPLQPGDSVTAAVSFQHSTFSLSIDAPREGDHFSTTHAGNAFDTSVAECIVEAPTIVDNPASNTGHLAQLTDFGTESISCLLNQNKPIASGPQDILYQMQTDTGIAKATASSLDQAGSTFTVQWHHG